MGEAARPHMASAHMDIAATAGIALHSCRKSRRESECDFSGFGKVSYCAPVLGALAAVSFSTAISRSASGLRPVRA